MSRGIIVPCFCTNCGHKAKRSHKNLHRPCPKCGGPMSITKEDQTMIVVVTAIAMVFALIMAIVTEYAKK